MGRFDTTKQTIDAKIKTNGNQAITGQVLNSVMKDMLSATDAELTELADTISEVEAAKADLINEGEKRIVVADGMVDNNDTYYYLPEFAPEGEEEHTFAMKADLKDVDTSSLEKVVAAALTDLDIRIQEMDAKIINSINADY